MAKSGFQKCFDDRYKQWQKCVVAQGFYISKEDVFQQLNGQYFLSYRHRLGTFESYFTLQDDKGREFTAAVIQELTNLWPTYKIINGRPAYIQLVKDPLSD
ncbi:hypothetical protein TNCV_4845761 [Trichonephila clavipes]|uniref:Uncharacterized protein n=1 Tax=Trichonephila clavipes TaxID=2585209 RepID=A0A8X6WJL6_TRICX|nr:hypothetical protein TNCV_4845761 [Trichonephila clavipes]